MNYKIFNGSTVGYKNIVKNSNSQDYLDYKVINDCMICCVADGHSGEFFKYSHIGSKLACICSIEVIEKIIDKTKEDIVIMLENEIIQKKIYENWMVKVQEHYKKNNPVVFKTKYIQYSTTLIVVALLKNCIMYLKIGDGSIIIKKDKNFKNIIHTKNNKIVDSLGRIDSFKNIMYYVDPIKNNNVDNIILFTDGYENSFGYKEKMYENLEITINKYNSSIFSRLKLIKEYNLYLSKLSKSVSLDDISIIFIM